MNTFIPKSKFLRKRALDLHRSGDSFVEIARKLQIGKSTAQRWAAIANKKPTITKMVNKAELAAAVYYAELPTLAFVPHIKLTSASKYQMVRPG